MAEDSSIFNFRSSISFPELESSVESIWYCRDELLPAEFRKLFSLAYSFITEGQKNTNNKDPIKKETPEKYNMLNDTGMSN